MSSTGRTPPRRRARTARWIVVVAVAGCGRIGIDARVDDAAPGGPGAPGARSTLRLDRVAPAAPLHDFPLPIRLDGSRADLAVLSPSTLRAFAEDGSELAVEIEAAGPPLVAWILVPRIAGTSTQLTLEYGRAAPSSRAVFSSSYLGVWHMTSDHRDSSPAARTTLDTEITTVPGVIGPAASYDRAAGSCLVVPSLTGVSYPEVTVSSWIRLNATSSGEYYALITRQFDDTASDDVYLGTDPDSLPLAALRVMGGGNLRVAATPLTAQAWHHVAYSYTGVSAALYIDGEVIEAGAATGVPTTSARPVFIGCGRNSANTAVDEPDGETVDGVLDEARFERVGRSDEWFAYTYEAGLDRVISYGPVESLP